MLQKSIFLILLSLSVALGYPQNPTKLNDPTPRKISLNTPSIHQIAYLKHISKTFDHKSVNSQISSHNFGRVAQLEGSDVVPIFGDTYLYGTVYWGTPAQKFTLLFETVPIYPLVINSNSCKSETCQKEWPIRFNTTASKTYKVVLPHFEANSVIANETFHILGTDDYFTATSNLMVADGKKLHKNEFIENEFHSNFSKVDGIFSLLYSVPMPQTYQPLKTFETPMSSLLKQFKSKILTLWIAQSNNVDRTKPVEAELTIGGLDKKHCKNDWKFGKMAKFSAATKNSWTVPVSRFEFGSNVSNRLKTAFFWNDRIDIYGPAKLVKPLLSMTEPYYANGTHPGSIKCKGGAVRKSLPNLKFTIHDKVYEITPQQYILDIEPEKDLCYLAVAPLDYFPYWILGQTFLSAYCTAFDYSQEYGKNLIGFASLLN